MTLQFMNMMMDITMVIIINSLYLLLQVDRNYEKILDMEETLKLFLTNTNDFETLK